MRHFLVLLAVLAAVAAVALAGYDARNKKDVWMKKRLAEKLRLHKAESNLIDHGPKHRSQWKKHRGHHGGDNNNGLLGHRGEHWAIKTGDKGKPKYGRQRNDRDDKRLQDVGFEQPKQQEVVQDQHVAEGRDDKANKKSHKKKFHPKKHNNNKDRLSKEELAVLRRQAKKAAARGLGPEAATHGLAPKSREERLARKFYNKWMAKVQKKANKKRPKSNIP